MVTPFSTAGLHSLAITALITAAEEHGFNTEGDVVEWLTSGSEKSYIKPLRTHVFHRLGIEWGSILGKITLALPSIIKINKMRKAKLAVLLVKNNYMYPLKEGTVDKFIMTKMYQSEIVLESLKIGFSGLDSIHIPKMYECPHPDFPQERELPPEIVALAATMAYAMLQHLLYDGAGNATDFSTPTLQSIYQGHMVKLLEWKRHFPRQAHRFLHEQYKTIIGVGGGVVGDQTTEDIIGEVDWDNMIELEDEAVDMALAAAA
ncbi:hypothetical protein HYPSUDRAFT_209813 [Hypholoma sublateritium FD-334 SS-4]|uniref:DUF6532 domain-containing protein n=1 Tax=Hypholoma sublateritium (strain FD-334 SS-4) TaxID=945553 RepID=A0A0D2N1P3_HYPSF|nr:hypothetical protein HYPSUDRAFT_209813 [Hypholoma sublateritium FD-334 SS-4]